MFKVTLEELTQKDAPESVSVTSATFEGSVARALGMMNAGAYHSLGEGPEDMLLRVVLDYLTVYGPPTSEIGKAILLLLTKAEIYNREKSVEQMESQPFVFELKIVEGPATLPTFMK